MVMRVLVALAGARAAAAAYLLGESYVSADFFSKWTFWSASDPTKGFVEYVSYPTAVAAGLVRAGAESVYIGADMRMKVAGGGRRSVRIQSRATYDRGLFVATLDHVPTGCGVWPALWMYGEDQDHIWPRWGEYDIVEGVHDASRTMTTLHTGSHCNQSGVREGRDFSGKWGEGIGVSADNCDIHAPGQWNNQGCSQQGPEDSMGSSFNLGGGGTYAAEWDPDAGHFRTWFWPKGSEPRDLIEGRPLPDSWHMPYSYFSLRPDVCEPGHFTNMRLVFDITFCGALGNPTFKQSCGAAGKNMTCEEYVASHPRDMEQAYWSIRALDVYHHGVAPSSTTEAPKPSLTPGVPPPRARRRQPHRRGLGYSWTPIITVAATFWAILILVSLYIKVWRKVGQDAPAVRDLLRGCRRGSRNSPSKVPPYIDLPDEDPWSPVVTQTITESVLPAPAIALLGCWASPSEVCETPMALPCPSPLASSEGPQLDREDSGPGLVMSL